MAYFMGYKKAVCVSKDSGGPRRLHSRPVYYGVLTAIWCGIPSIVLFSFWNVFESKIITHIIISEMPVDIHDLPTGHLALIINDIKNLVYGNITSGHSGIDIHTAAERYIELRRISRISLTVVLLATAVLGLTMARNRITEKMRARNHVEKALSFLMAICSVISILTTIGIVLSVLYEAICFFKAVPVSEFLFGLQWSPQTAIRQDQIGSTGAFGAVPVFVGTILISAIAMLVAVPIGLMSAIYMSEYAGKKFRTIVKPMLEILAGIPTVVYGFFAALVVAPFIRDIGDFFGLSVSSESALAAGSVMGIMIIPFVSSLSDDVINAVPQSLRDGAYGIGATQSETIKSVILPAALPGIVGGILLAVSRAIGETMIVVMAAGLSANLTANPFKAVTTVTVQIVTLLVGDQEFDSPKTLAAFALGLVLFFITLCLNIIALYVVRKYREQYE
jgi:phosphate transport system permease protein